MPLNAIRQSLEIEELAGTQTGQALIRAESLVPGAGREAIDVLMAEADIVLGNVDVQADRVVVDAVAPCQAVFRRGEETALRALTTRAALNYVFDMPGIQPGLPYQIHGQVEHVEARYENGHMVFLVSVQLAVQVMRLSPAQVITKVEGAVHTEEEFQEIESVKLAAEKTADVRLTDEISLPTALDARMALMDWAGVQVEEAAPDLGGIRVKGKLELETLVSSGVAGRPAALIKYPLSFDQLIELPEWLIGNVYARATIRQLTTQVDQGEEGEDAVLRIEAEVRILIQAMTSDKVLALADAYATSGYGLAVRRAPLRYAERVERTRFVETFRGPMLLPEGAPGVGTVLAARVRPNLGGWTEEDGRAILEGLLEAEALYMPSGSDQLTSVRAELPFRIPYTGTLNQDSWVWVEAAAADATALMGDQLELKCSLVVHAETRIMAEKTLVENIEEADPKPSRPGIVIYWPETGDTPWSIGKRYGVPVDAVLSTNPEAEAIRPGKALILKI